MEPVAARVHGDRGRAGPGERVLDVCAGTSAIGIALLKREPTLEVHAIDRSAAMQEVGRQRADALGFHCAAK